MFGEGGVGGDDRCVVRIQFGKNILIINDLENGVKVT